jgi:hypothetical protein
MYASKMFNKKAQVWVETAIYTLIGLTIIAILLSAATPQITKLRDRGVVTQTSDALNILDNKIDEIKQSAGNIRVIDFKIAKGRLEIDSKEDTIVYILEDTNLKLSEPGETIQEGDMLIQTLEYGSRFSIRLIMNYSEVLDLTHDLEGEQKRILQAGTTPYKIQIENIGDNAFNEPTHINFNVL